MHFTYIIFIVLLFTAHRVNHLKAKRHKHANCYVLITSTQDNYKWRQKLDFIGEAGYVTQLHSADQFYDLCGLTLTV